MTNSTPVIPNSDIFDTEQIGLRFRTTIVTDAATQQDVLTTYLLVSVESRVATSMNIRERLEAIDRIIQQSRTKLIENLNRKAVQ